MKKMIIISGFVLAAALLAGFFWFRQQTPSGRVEEKTYDIVIDKLLKHSVPEISVSDLANNFDQYTILDSRTEEEYKVSHLPGAIWIGAEGNMQLEKVKEIAPNTAIVIYCSVGLRSEQAAERLRSASYKNVSNLYGGIFEWSNQLKPLVNEQNESTKAVHGYNMIWAKWIRNGEVRFN